MDFIALIIAGIAIGIALKARSRIALLEHNLGLVAKRLEGGAATETPPAAREEKPASPLDVWASPAQPQPEAPAQPQAARTDESDIEKIIAEASQPPAPPAEPSAPAKSFEERFGASWVVWIGGLALALGGIFLVQYSIEAGLIGPAVRVFLGGLLATGAGRGRRMDATARDRQRRRVRRQRAHPEHPHRRRHHRRVRDDLCGLRALRLPRARHRLRAARHRGARNARRRTAAWAGARCTRPGRRIPCAAARCR